MQAADRWDLKRIVCSAGEPQAENGQPLTTAVTPPE
jgi:hypothetical protein